MGQRPNWEHWGGGKKLIKKKKEGKTEEEESSGLRLAMEDDKGGQGEKTTLSQTGKITTREANKQSKAQEKVRYQGSQGGRTEQAIWSICWGKNDKNGRSFDDLTWAETSHVPPSRKE